MSDLTARADEPVDATPEADQLSSDAEVAPPRPVDPNQARDARLIDRARSGDLDAFNDLVGHYQDQLFALVARMVPDRDQASDVVQEAFFSAYRNLANYRGGAVKSWLAGSP